MHENREISCTSWSSDQDRSAKALNRVADGHPQEKSDCAVVPVNQPNKEGQLSVEDCSPLFGWFTGATAQSDFSCTCMPAVRFRAFADRS